MWERVVDRLGAYEGHGSVLRVEDVELTFERGDAHLQVAYRGCQVIGIAILPNQR